MFEAVVFITATGILVVEFIEWKQKGKQYSDATPDGMAYDWTIRFREKGETRHIVTAEGTR